MQPIAEVTPASAAPYPVWCGGDIPRGVTAAWQPEWTAAVVVADERTAAFATPVRAALEARGVRCLTRLVPPGEVSKSRETKAAIEDVMLGDGIDRRACVVAVGGGVVLDLAGFVAATYMRGIAHLNVATTLLAQVDAAIGGKTAINTPAGKNLIGAFHHPRAVFLHTDALDELPEVELRNGLAEAVKLAALRDASLFDELERWGGIGGLRPSDAIVARCVTIKAEVIAADDRDQGQRNILNFGHTVGHAIEGATAGAVPHGHAVAIGMVVEARSAVRAGRLPAAHLDRLAALLEVLGLPTEPPCPFEAVQPFLARDKKTEGAVLRCAVPTELGRTEPEANGRWTREVGIDELSASWATGGQR